MAVNTYRFVAMYLLIGLVMGAVTLIGQSTDNHTQGYNLKQQERIEEQSNNKDQIISQSDNLVKSNSFSLTSNWGDENSFGRNIVEALSHGLLPRGFIPRGYNASEIEIALNWLLVIFRSIIGIFAVYEIFQIIIKSKQT